MKNKTLIIIGIVLIGLIGASYFVYSNLQKAIIQPQGFHYFLKSGTTPRKFARDLNLASPDIILVLLKEHPGRHMQVGEYFFKGGSTAEEVVNQVLNGQVMRHSFTIIDGWNIYQVMNSLAQAPVIQHTLTGASPKMIAQTMNMPYPTPEGWLYPDTYYYTWNMTDVSILNRAYAAMQSYMDEMWMERSPGLPYTSPYDALIVASMIQKETGYAQEMPYMADVILKRLFVKMPLQIDSTVIYGLMPGFSGKLTHNLVHTNTSYNTYTNTGLPPTPISMPSKNAIYAALHPVSSSAWYFVSKGDGTHFFSATLKQQDQAIDTYQRNKPNQPVKPNQVNNGHSTQ